MNERLSIIEVAHCVCPLGYIPWCQRRGLVSKALSVECFNGIVSHRIKQRQALAMAISSDK
jgi:hypothetical protein